ncbi:alpha-(1-_6)-mannopyranosyltransferase A [Corynebacterium ureicelerivorans]|uniref:alpha-(1->6)-mannopyranosyltransferase A n=1 Tax=Corynebacterium ureicelerivorans TaxID=401472 RepID=UPI00068A7085|nr:alpha-(1->6)-mannopyranosyltransferase A [Corynebacterium ureicelerivorans]
MRRHPRALGFAACVLIAVGSFGAGATRYRGGVLRELGLDFLAFGHGRGLMDLLLTAGIVGLVVAWVMLWKARPSARQMRRTVWWWTGALACSAPILSRDVYSYLMQGAMLRDGFDPYSEGAAVNPGPFLWEVSHDWRNTTTPYGPLHLGLGKAVTTLVGDNVTAGLIAYRLIAVAGFALIVWSVPRIAKAIGGDPALALWLGVANPVMLLHLIGGMHNEAVMVGLVSLGLLSCLRGRWCTPGIALIALAVSLKATAAVALPFVVWLMVQRHSSTALGRAGMLVVSGAWALVVNAAVVQLVTVASGTTWGWLAQITGNSKVINPLAGPTLAAELLTPLLQLVDDTFRYNTALSWTRSVFSVLMLVGLVAVWWLFRPRPGTAYERRAVAGTTAAYAVAFVANAVTLPWYYASLISLTGTFRPPAWVVKGSTGASIVVALAFQGSGNHRLYDAWFLALAAIGAVVAVEWLFRDASKTPWPARDESPRGPSGREAHLQDAPAESRPA